MSITNGIEICGIEAKCINASERDEKIIRLFRKMRLPAMAETYECMVAEGLLNSTAICSDISLMRNVKLLIIDDWLNA